MPWLENTRTAAAKTMAPGRALTRQESGAPKYSRRDEPSGRWVRVPPQTFQTDPALGRAGD